MSSLTLKVTDAGRAAIVNAQHNGTAPVLVSQFGVTSTAFVAAADTAALPGEIKRLATIAGAAVAANTIHVTIRDDTADVYTIRGFAFYLDDGTLFASYGQADPIGEKSAQSMFLLALDAIFADIDANALTFGNTDFALNSATTEREGIIELATQAEAEAGADATRAMTPATHKGAVDVRFGAGAPSGFVKSLLTAATAIVFRAALGLKAAALYDVGTGNNLDADLLDGQHGSYYRAWANLTGIPSAYPPLPHTHAWNDITGAPAYATRWADWTEVTNKPATFPPAAHSQDWSTILNIPATASRWPAWGEVTGKPVFAAVATSGSYNDLANKPALAAVATSGSYTDLANSPDLSVYMPKAGGGFTGGINFGGVLAGSTSDVSKHINLYAGVFGVGVTGRGLNWVTNSAHYFVSAAGTDYANISSSGITAIAYNTSSDPRLKAQLYPQAAPAVSVDVVGLWQWQWNAASKRHGSGAGVRSDEVRLVFPQCVTVDADGFDVVDYGKLGVHLGVTAHQRIKAAEARADNLALALELLTQRLVQLEQRMASNRPQGMPPL